MSNRKKLAWLALALGLLFVACFSFLSPTRTRNAPPALSSAPDAAPAQSTSAVMFSTKDSVGLTQPHTLGVSSAVPDRKLIHNADLKLTVADVRAAADQIQRITEAGRGELEKLEISGDSESMSATLVVRIPASGLVTALAEYKKLAIRTDHEQITASDVTRQFYDNEAHLRSLRAEEQQYLTIMKQAGKIPDILEVSEKLGDVRDRIERLQSDMQVMSHDIDMSAVQISLSQQINTQVRAAEWRPLNNAKAATRDLLVGLGAWVDWIVQVLIVLPLILLWTVTLGGLMWIVWKVVRAVWRRLVKDRIAGLKPDPPVCGGVLPTP